MKNFFILLFTLPASLFTFHASLAQIIHVPGDQLTIQAGIDAASDGDTVLVDPGTYLENINFEGKGITVGSLFLTTQDTLHISQTIIDGGNAESVVIFGSGENSLTLLCGLTLTNGASSPFNGACGGGIYCQNASPRIENVCITNNQVCWKGGGLYCLYSDPVLMNVKITGNDVSGDVGFIPYPVLKCGGGIYCEQSNPVLINVTINNNHADDFGGGIYCLESNPDFSSINRCSIYENTAYKGKDIYTASFLEFPLDTFTVLYPTDYYATPLDSLSLEVQNGVLQQTDADLYISIDGDNSNSGLTPDEPLRNISYAFSINRADSSHHHTYYLAEGEYNPATTGEDFPVEVIDYADLHGTSDTGTILNSDSTGGVLEISYNSSNTISNMTLTGGNGDYGGIYCDHSSPNLNHIIISDNNAYVQFAGGSGGAGGGISCNYSNPSMNDVRIKHNLGGMYGGGIYAFHSSLYLNNVFIQNNHAGFGGGMYLAASQAEFHDVCIAFNYANWDYSQGGGICASGSSIIFDSTDLSNIYMNAACIGNEVYSNSPMTIVVDTFTVQTPTEFLASPLTYFTFDILNPLYAQVTADLYVSPDGNNLNSGLTPGDPLKNIHCALSVILPDIQHTYTINLLEGLYSDSSNNELFPLTLPDHINLKGITPEDVLLDAENNSAVMFIDYNSSNNISGMTIMRGSESGICIYNSNPTLKDVVIKDNYRLYGVQGCGGGFGGGIFCDGSNPVFQNVVIDNNIASNSGYGAYIANSHVEFNNLLIKGNDISASSSELIMENATFVNSPFRPLCLSSGSKGTLTNSIVWPQNTYGIYVPDHSDTIIISYSDIKEGINGTYGSGKVYWLEGNIEMDPLFDSLGEYPYALTSGSPCIDAGTPDTSGLMLPLWDILGNSRLWDGDGDMDTIIDMGAYEYGSIPYNVGIMEQVRSSQLAARSYPNPFIDKTTVEFNLPKDMLVTLELYDLMGREVGLLVNGVLGIGEHSYILRSGDLQSGIYILQVTAIPGFTGTGGKRQTARCKLVVQ